MVIFAGLLAAAGHAAVELPPVPITTHDLVEVTEIMGPALSPDGQRIAYRVTRPSIVANRTRLDWYVVGIDGGAPVHAGGGGTAQVDGAGLVAEQAPLWDSDSRGFRFLALIDGKVAIWHWRDDAPARAEIMDDADILDFAAADGGRGIHYTIGATRAEVEAAEKEVYDRGALVDAQVDLNQAVAGGVIEDGKRIMLRFNGPWFDRKRILWDAPRSEKTVMFGTQAGRTAPSPPPSTRQAEAVEAPDGSHAWIDRDKAVIVTRPGGETLRCTVAACMSHSLAAISWQPGDDALLLFDEEGGGRERVWSWSVGARHARLVTVTDGALRVPGRPPRCALARSSLICAESRPLVPPRLVRIDYRTGERKLLAEPNRALGERIRAEATPLLIEGRYSAMLLRPLKAAGPLPVVVQNYHCGGFLKGGTGEELPMLPLVEHGIAILCIDPFFGPKARGTEGTYQLALDVITRALDDLAGRRIIDPARVGIAGFSHSSGVALWALRHSKRFAAATIGTGQISPHYYWSNALPGRGFTEVLRDYWNIGDPDSDAARWKIASAAENVALIDTPLLMQLPDVEASWTAELHTKLKRAGKPAEMIVYADELHNKYQPVHKAAVYERNLDWFRFWLRGEEDHSPEKAGQYERWRQYRAGQSLPAPAP